MGGQSGHIVVTGAAGFIGSHLCDRLLADGREVVGIDSFEDYYPRPYKEANVAGARAQEGFTLLEQNLLEADLASLFDGAACVYHLAAQAGVRASWGTSFDVYTRNNVLATQQLLEAAVRARVPKVVYASSSSVYGDQDQLPLREDMLPKPRSPYGVTKLAGEHLCCLYAANHGLDTTSLRFFTVYGPRQRPDMAFHKFIRALLDDRENRLRWRVVLQHVQRIFAGMEAALAGGHANAGECSPRARVLAPMHCTSAPPGAALVLAAEGGTTR